MANFCGFCGVKLDSGMRICPNCGRLLKNQTAAANRPVKTAAPAAKQTPPAKKQPRAVRASAPVKKQPPRKQPARPQPKKPDYDEDEEEEEPGRSAVLVLVKRAVIAVIIIAAIYFSLFFLQVLRVKHTTYEFNVPSSWMSAENFGQAFENSTEDGSWHYNPFTFRVRYTAKHNGDDIEVVFSALGDVEVKKVTVDGEEKTEKEDISTTLMGLFI